MKGRLPIYVTNRRAQFTGNIPREALDPYWSYAVANWKWVTRARPGWDGVIHKLDNGDGLPAGLFWATKKDIEQETGYSFDIDDELETPSLKFDDHVISTGNYEFQNEATERIMKALRFGGGLILNATGSGKTRIAAMVFSRLAGNVCFIVDQLILMEQARRDIQRHMGEKVGWVGNSEFEPERVTVATVQTMHKHRKQAYFRDWTRTLEVVFIDEIHEQMNKRNFDVVKSLKPLAVFGLTATLQLKKKHIRLQAWSLCGPVVYEYPLARGQEDEVLARGIVMRVGYENPIELALQKVLKWPDLYRQFIVDDEERNYLVERLVRIAHAKGKYVIVLVSQIKHLQNLSKAMTGFGIDHRVIAGMFEGDSIPVEERLLYKDEFEAGDVRVILANVVFKKGVDIKRVDVIIDAAGFKSKNDAIQKFGRGVRLHAEKTGLLYFDICDQDKQNKENPFQRNARIRARAYRQTGIPVFKMNAADWGAWQIFQEAERQLGLELKRAALAKQTSESGNSGQSRLSGQQNQQSLALPEAESLDSPNPL